MNSQSLQYIMLVYSSNYQGLGITSIVVLLFLGNKVWCLSSFLAMALLLNGGSYQKSSSYFAGLRVWRSTQTRLVCYVLINLVSKLNRSCTLVCDGLNIEDNWAGITLHNFLMNWLQKNRCYKLLPTYVIWGIWRFWIYTHHWFFICSDQRLGIDYLYRYGNRFPVFGHRFVFL